jgi:hypothetical protein
MVMKLSDAQFRMLEDVVDLGDPWHRVRGRSAHGGAQGTLAFLLRRRLIKYDEVDGFRATQAGHAMLEENGE